MRSFAEQPQAARLWQTLSVHARPAGFVAVDLLRIEAGFVLFTNEFRLPVLPREAGLGKFSRSANMSVPEITLVSFRADADHLRMAMAAAARARAASQRLAKSQSRPPAKASWPVEFSVLVMCLLACTVGQLSCTIRRAHFATSSAPHAVL